MSWFALNGKPAEPVAVVAPVEARYVLNGCVFFLLQALPQGGPDTLVVFSHDKLLTMLASIEKLGAEAFEMDMLTYAKNIEKWRDTGMRWPKWHANEIQMLAICHVFHKTDLSLIEPPPQGFLDAVFPPLAT